MSPVRLFSFNTVRKFSTPTVMLQFAILGYSLALGIALPNGVSKEFFFTLFLVSLAMIVVTSIALLTPKLSPWFLTRSNNSKIIDRRIYWFSALPMSIMFQHFWSNKELFPISQTVYLTSFILSLGFLWLYLMPKYLKTICDANNLYFLNLSIFITLLLAPSLSREFNWYSEGDFFVLFFVFAGYFCVPLLISKFLTSLCLFFTAMVVASNFIGPLLTEDIHNPNSQNTSELSGKKLTTILDELETFEFKPNIYLLLYESLANNETMAMYGYDNTGQSQHLMELGFTTYEGIHSNGVDTLQSISTMLNLSNQPISGKGWRYAVAGNGAVHDMLRKQEYSFDIFSYNGYFTQGLPRREVGIKNIYPSESPSFLDFIYAILAGEFKFEYTSPRVPYEDFIAFKRNYFATNIELGPRMLLTRSPLPNHSQNSGICLPDEKEIYIGNVHKSNLEMRNDVKQILKNDPNAVIVIFGDHGPYLTKNCDAIDHLDPTTINILDLQDRVGTFLAIYWPEFVKENHKHNITTLQDIFPAIISNLSSGKIEFQDLQTNNFSCRIHREICIDNGMIRGGVNDNTPLFKTRTYPVD